MWGHWNVRYLVQDHISSEGQRIPTQSSVFGLQHMAPFNIYSCPFLHLDSASSPPFISASSLATPRQHSCCSHRDSSPAPWKSSYLQALIPIRMFLSPLLRFFFTWINTYWPRSQLKYTFWRKSFLTPSSSRPVLFKRFWPIVRNTFCLMIEHICSHVLYMVFISF